MCVMLKNSSRHWGWFGSGTKTTVLYTGRVIFTEGKRSGNETVLDGTLVFIMLRLLPPFLLPSPFSFLSPSFHMCSTVCTVAVLIFSLAP